MIYTILEKCLIELNKEEIDASYIRGMIETLLAMQEKPSGILISGGTPTSSYVATPIVTDDASILDARAKASIAIVKAMSEASKE